MNIQEALKGYTISHCLYVGIKSGIFDIISKYDNKGVTPDIIVNDLKLNRRYVQIWLNTAYAFGFFNLKDDKYYLLDGYKDFLLDDTNPKYQGEMLKIFIDHLSHDMRNQPEFMKNDKKYSFSEHDMEFVELVSKRGYLRSQSMIYNYIENNGELLNIFKKNSIVCDVGGGTGSFLSGLKEKYPEPKYICIDSDEKSINIGLSLNNEIEYIYGDIVNTNIKKNIHCIIMVLTLHEIKSNSRINVLKKCYEQLVPGGKILIMEFPYPEKASEFNDSRYIMGILDQYYEMIWDTKQIGWSVQKELLELSGFKNIRKNFLSDGIYVLIEAEKI